MQYKLLTFEMGSTAAFEVNGPSLSRVPHELALIHWLQLSCHSWQVSCRLVHAALYCTSPSPEYADDWWPDTGSQAAQANNTIKRGA